MKGALIFIGDELIAGRILNTNAEFAGKVLSSIGLIIGEIVTIPDDEEKIIKTLKRLEEEYDFVITSGGLGPTEDDFTLFALAKAFNLKLIQNEALISAILSNKEYKSTLDMAKRMSLIPEGAYWLAEGESMVGFYLPYQGKLFFFLPGVPEQFQFLLKNKVLPILCNKEQEQTKKEGCKEDKIIKNLVFFDLNETDLNKFMYTLVEEEPPKIGYYPIFPEVKVVLFGIKEKVEKFTEALNKRFKFNLVSKEDESLNQVIGRLLRAKGQTLATAESCTGGMLASLITNISGSSAYFERGFITYTEESKREILGVSKETLEQYGVYSYETALEMAIGAKRLARTHYALSTTGIAGPTGGTSEIPVGTVFIGFATPSKAFAFHFHFNGDRIAIQRIASFTALDILRRYILYGESFFSYRFALGIKERTLES
ncbi:MAG: nicotinamide-nucleotide amidohydrolase family protein [Caldimicrobium sp.]